MKKKLVFFVLLFFVFSTTLLKAQEAEEKTSEELAVIVITGDRVETNKKELSTNISVINSQKVEKSSANNLGELLRQEGFQVRQYPGTLSTVGMRGFRTNAMGNDNSGYILILLNGRRIGTGNLAKIATNNVERIEIIRGPAAVQYGSAAMGGVINVITKRGTEDFKGEVEVGFGSNELFQGKTAFSGMVDKFDFSFGYTHSNASDYDLATEEKYKYTGYKARESFNLDTGYNFNDYHRLGLNINYFDVNNSHIPQTYQANQGYSVADKRNYALDFTYEGKAENEKWSWFTRYSFGEDKDFTEDRTLWNSDDFGTKVDSNIFQGQVTYDEALFRLTAGFDYLKYKIETTSAPEKAEYENLAGFLLGRLRLFDEKLIFSAGTRYDDYQAKDKTKGESVNNDRFTSSAGVSYLPVEWLKLRANYAQAFVAPSPEQLFYYYSDGWYTYHGNPNLSPEKSKTWELGFDTTFRHLNFGFTYFETKSDDFIVAVPVLGGVPNTYKYDNIDSATRRGIELEFDIDFGELLYKEYRLAPYVKATKMLTYKDDKTGENLRYVPNHTLAFGLDFDHPAYGLKTNVNVSYFGTEEINDWSSGSGIARHGKYHTVDFSVEKSVWEFEDDSKLNVKLKVNNFFDEEYEPVKGYPAPGRNFYLGLAYSF